MTRYKVTARVRSRSYLVEDVLGQRTHVVRVVRYAGIDELCEAVVIALCGRVVHGGVASGGICT